jgi:hypothetical protein
VGRYHRRGRQDGNQTALRLRGRDGGSDRAHANRRFGVSIGGDDGAMAWPTVDAQEGKDWQVRKQRLQMVSSAARCGGEGVAAAGLLRGRGRWSRGSDSERRGGR